MKRADLDALQLERLRRMVDYCYNNVPFYNERLKAAGITSGDRIKTLSDIQYIPFTTKDDIRDHYPFGMLARPMKDIVRIHASSGTTGKPTVGAYTQNDLDNWSDNVARLCAAAGVTDEDIIQIAFGYGLFTGALGLHYGLEKLGATVIPASSGNSEKQLMMMRDFGVTGLVATPSYAIYLSELVREGFPVLRYRTKDITRINYEPCACGRTHARMDKVMGRTDDMLIIKGVNVFPSQIESVLVGTKGISDKIGPHYQLVVRRKNYMDNLEVKVELIDASLLSSFRELEVLQRAIHDRLKSVLGLETKVTLAEPKSLERFQGKAKRVLDLRNMED